jgi:hypothetical protein
MGSKEANTIGSSFIQNCSILSLTLHFFFEFITLSLLLYFAWAVLELLLPVSTPSCTDSILALYLALEVSAL